MASASFDLCLFLLLTFSFSLQVHARESQFFNKIPSTTTTKDVVTSNKHPVTVDSEQKQQEQQPAFLPENDGAYGLYGHETGQLPPAAAGTNGDEYKQSQPLPKSLPKNYNPVAYVTEPEETTGSTEFNGEQSYAVNPNSNSNYYYTNGRNGETASRNYNYYPTGANNRYVGSYDGGSSLNGQPQGMKTNYAGFRAGGEGMSDTRLLDHGKYFYDVNGERYSGNHPYERLRRNYYYGNSERNGQELYGNQQELQGEAEDLNMP